MRKLLYNYKRNCNRVRSLKERIEYLRTQAEKITPTLSDDKGMGSHDSSSRVEENVIKIIELERQLKITEDRVNKCDDFLENLKPYQRYIITNCIVNHIPYAVIAKRENTTPQNVSKIVNKAIKEKPLE